jgi:hypothetical protein
MLIGGSAGERERDDGVHFGRITGTSVDVDVEDGHDGRLRAVMD